MSIRKQSVGKLCSLLFSLSLLTGLALVGCSGPHVSVDPEWKEAPARFTVLTTAPFTSNADDITDDFGDQDVFRQWFVSYLDTALAISSPVSHSVKLIDDGALEMELMDLGGALLALLLIVHLVAAIIDGTFVAAGILWIVTAVVFALLLAASVYMVVFADSEIRYFSEG